MKNFIKYTLITLAILAAEIIISGVDNLAR